MKKIVGIMAAAALATSAFAEINISSWNRQDVIPFNFVNDDGINSYGGTNWTKASENPMGKNGLSFSASSENAGFALDLAYCNSGLDRGDNAYAWVKPVEMLKLSFGRIDYNKGKQAHCYGHYDHAWRFQGDNFKDLGDGLAIGGRAARGFVVELTPVEGLWIDASCDVQQDDRAYKTFWSNASYGIGYDKEGLGSFRVVVFGKDGSATATTQKKNFDDVSVTNLDGNNAGPYAVIAAAADITAVENLFMTFGVSVPTSFGKYGTLDLSDRSALKATQADTFRASAAASYKLDPVTFHAVLDTKFGILSAIESSQTSVDFKYNGFGYAAGLGADIKLTDMFTLITDVRFCNAEYVGSTGTMVMKENSKTEAEVVFNRGKFGGYLGLCQQLTNAKFDFGVECGVNQTIFGAETNDFTVAIPLQIQVEF